MKLTRRTLLAGSGVGLGVAAAPAFTAGLSARETTGVIADRSIPAGRHAADYARKQGLPLSEQGGDIAGLLYGVQESWLADGRKLIGVTGYSGVVVARGLARELGRDFTQHRVAWDAAMPQAPVASCVQTGDLHGQIAEICGHRAKGAYLWTIA